MLASRQLHPTPSVILALLFILAGGGCAAQPAIRPAGLGVDNFDSAIQPEGFTATQKNAAASLTEQGRRLLGAGRLDEAIRILEQAITVYYGSAATYYYLAEAWIIKGNPRQALTFNRLAALYCGADTAWRPKIAAQWESAMQLERSQK